MYSLSNLELKEEAEEHIFLNFANSSKCFLRHDWLNTKVSVSKLWNTVKPRYLKNNNFLVEKKEKRTDKEEVLWLSFFQILK